jgi:anti-sigma factor RsiW
MNEHLSAETIERLADGELVSDPHLAECAACANEVLSIVQMKRAIAALPRHAHVGAGSQPARWRPHGPAESRPLHLPLQIAAAIAILALLSAFALAYLRGRDAARELVDLHATIVAGAQPVDVLSTDRHTVKPWFEGRVPFAVDVPDLSATPFRIVGGRTVFWRGRPGAYLLVTKGAHRISVFAFSADDAPRIGDLPQMTIVSWRQSGVRYVAIGDIPRNELEQLQETFSALERFSRHAQSTLRRGHPSRVRVGLRRPDGDAPL